MPSVRLPVRSFLVALIVAATALPAARPARALDETPGPTPRVIRGPAAGAPAGDGRLAWHDLDTALAEARRANKPVLVDVYTDWCGWCKRMDKTTYGNPEVRDYVARTFVPARVNAENDRRAATYRGERRTDRQFADGFRISGYPTTVFLAPDGELITLLPGYVKPATFLTVLHYVGDGHYRTQTWDAFSRAGGDGRR